MKEKAEQHNTQKNKQSFILRWVQRHMGTAVLEEKTLGQLTRKILSSILQSIAMSTLPFPPSFRVMLQRMRGVRIGKNVFIGMRCCLDAVRPDLITLGDDVSLAGNVTILTHSQPPGPIRVIFRNKLHVTKPVIIKDGAWIAVNTTILPGVTIGKCAIVSAGSTVKSDVLDFMVVEGVPAQNTRSIPQK